MTEYLAETLGNDKMLWKVQIINIGSSGSYTFRNDAESGI